LKDKKVSQNVLVVDPLAKKTVVVLSSIIDPAKKSGKF
jgi:hypothetical protein